ncbi:glutaminyl-peptide cyclotransferase [Dasania marina]|uniref:glutaminyl-peptide cyclotransferase n=1 Tax=Dasania marina TaxID=471499 RepID=UPI0030DCF5ED|tara:strand:- start:7968 stop:8747 length:780 start_codon:yes stop_codon:yes gene_type:complete
MPFLVFLLSLLLANNSFADDSFAEQAVSQYGYTVVAQYPHDPQLFTQGLAFDQGKLYESAGRYGHSRLTVRELAYYTVLQQQVVQPQLFAEGITLLNNNVYQLTWKAGLALVYAARDLSPVAQHRYQGQGWGLCTDGQQLIMSDGSDQLHFINPDNFSRSHSINVTERGQSVTNLNELEWVQGKIYANIWMSSRIVIINPNNGHVEGSVDLSDLLPASLRKPNTDVLNGIAYDSQQQRLFVTGKNWPRLYHISLTAAKP